jgi:isftu1 transposase
MDESGIDSNMERQYARAKRGNQVKSEVCGKKGERTSLISAFIHHTKTLIAPYVFNGYTDAIRFNGWLKECLLPTLKKGTTIIMDNAAFHKTKRTKELIEAVGCKLLYLPPYSPDLNPIEKQWAKVKVKYKTGKYEGLNHKQAIDYAFSV